MKMFLISDNIDTQTGMRLAGVEGVVVHTKQEVLSMLDKLLHERDVGIIMITEKLGKLVLNEINDIKLKYATPLIVEVPDRHGSSRSSDSIKRYVREAIGVKI